MDRFEDARDSAKKLVRQPNPHDLDLKVAAIDKKDQPEYVREAIQCRANQHLQVLLLY